MQEGLFSLMQMAKTTAAIEKFKDATGYEEFLDFDPAEVKAALDDPEKSHADEMLSAAEKVASEKMTVLVVEPMKEPYVKEIDPDLHSLQAELAVILERLILILTRWRWSAMMKASSSGLI
jgi:hypothetical protein